MGMLYECHWIVISNVCVCVRVCPILPQGDWQGQVAAPCSLGKAKNSSDLLAK